MARSDSRIKFEALDFTVWDKPRRRRWLKDVLTATFVDNPFSIWGNVGLFDFSLGAQVFGIGAGIGWNTPFYTFVSLYAFGFHIDISSGFYRDYSPLDEPRIGIDIDALQAEARAERAAVTVALSQTAPAQDCCEHEGDDPTCTDDCQPCFSSCCPQPGEAVEPTDIADDEEPVNTTPGDVSVSRAAVYTEKPAGRP